MGKSHTIAYQIHTYLKFLFFLFNPGCLILTAFGLAGSVNHNFSRQADSFNHMGTGRKMEFALPWAIVVSGVGGFFAAVAGVVMVVFWVFKDRREVPGMWIPF